MARLSALAELGELRMLALRLPGGRALASEGPTRARLDALAGALSEGLGVRIGPGAVLAGLGLYPSESEELRAAALAVRVHHQADERFDAEDFRNPAAARWLSGLWAKGSALDADALGQALSGEPLSLAEVGRRWVEVLGA